jgi:hypothetical protein
MTINGACTLVDSARLRPGMTVVSRYRGIGIPQSAIPTGFAQPALGANKWPAGAPASAQLLLDVVPPSVGTFTLNEDTSFSFTGAPDGTYTGAETVTLGGQADTGSYSFTIGAGADIVLAVADCVQPNTCQTVAIIVTEGGAMSFTPSAARTVTVQPDKLAFTAGSFWNMDDPKKPRGLKDPDDTIDIPFDWGPWLADVGNDIIATRQFFVDGGLVNEGDTATDTVATVFVSAGDSGSSPTSITCRITTASVPARIADRTVYLTIEER